MIGWIAQWGGCAAGGSGNGRGIYGLAQTDNATQTSVTNWLKYGSEPVLGSPRSQGGAYASDQATIPNDLTIPTVDFYGNSTLGSSTAPYTLTDYQQSEIWGNECNNGSPPAPDLTKTGDACQVGLASWNAAAMAGTPRRPPATLHPTHVITRCQPKGGRRPRPR